MATNPNSNIHNDTWMTDAYQRRGPLGNALVTQSEAKPPSLCGSLAFDSCRADRQRLPLVDGAARRPGDRSRDSLATLAELTPAQRP